MNKRFSILFTSLIMVIAMMPLLAPGFAFAETPAFTSKTATIYRENGLDNVADEVSDAFSDPLVERVLVFDTRVVRLRDAVEDKAVQNTLVGRGTASKAVGVDFRRTYQYS